MAWIVEVEPLCAGMLHVLQTHRRQGLGRLVCLDLFHKLELVRQQAARCEGKQQQLQDVGLAQAAVYCYIVDDNAASIALMESIGLKKTGVFLWLGFERTSN